MLLVLSWRKLEILSKSLGIPSLKINEKEEKKFELIDLRAWILNDKIVIFKISEFVFGVKHDLFRNAH